MEAGSARRSTPRHAHTPPPTPPDPAPPHTARPTRPPSLPQEDFLPVFAANTVGPFLVVQQLLAQGLLGAPGGRSTVVNITSIMGSNTDPTISAVTPGAFAYRSGRALWGGGTRLRMPLGLTPFARPAPGERGAGVPRTPTHARSRPPSPRPTRRSSKAALNSVSTTLARDFERDGRGIDVALVHPGAGRTRAQRGGGRQLPYSRRPNSPRDSRHGHRERFQS